MQTASSRIWTRFADFISYDVKRAFMISSEMYFAYKLDNQKRLDALGKDWGRFC